MEITMMAFMFDKAKSQARQMKRAATAYPISLDDKVLSSITLL
jgi:hypothetical protein